MTSWSWPKDSPVGLELEAEYVWGFALNSHVSLGFEPSIGGRAGDAALRCPRCGSHFAVRQAGAGLEQPELHLDPLPLLVDAGTATVALPTPVPA